MAERIRPSDYTKLASRSILQMVQLAEEMMDASRVMTALLPDCARLRLLGFNDARLICHLTGQSQRFEGRRFSSLRDAAQVCMRMRVCVRVCVCVCVCVCLCVCISVCADVHLITNDGCCSN